MVLFLMIFVMKQIVSMNMAFGQYWYEVGRLRTAGSRAGRLPQGRNLNTALIYLCTQYFVLSIVRHVKKASAYKENIGTPILRLVGIIP